MSLALFAQYAAIASLFLILVLLVFTLLQQWSVRKTVAYTTAMQRVLMDEMNTPEVDISDFDRHIATTIDMIDDTKD